MGFITLLVPFAERQIIIMKRKVVIITDCIDVALMEIRGAIHTYSNNAEYEIEPIVQVDNFSIVNTSFLFDLMVNAYPPGTVICIVVNPNQLRTERIIGRLNDKDIIFDGTNTGALGRVIKKYGCKELYEIYDDGFVPFGGKYVHAPTVGKVLSGVPMNTLGHAFDVNSIRNVEINEGTILHIDNFGNVKLEGSLAGATNGDTYLLKIGDCDIKAIFWTRMMERNDEEIVIYPGSSFGLPEIGIVRGSFSQRYNLSVGDKITYTKEIENLI